MSRITTASFVTSLVVVLACLTNSVPITDNPSTTEMDNFQTTSYSDFTSNSRSRHWDTTILPTKLQHQEPAEDVFSSDEAIRHLPGYWIKRPISGHGTFGMLLAAANPLNVAEEEENAGEAQESFIDYRTERYQIKDLFHDALGSAQKTSAENVAGSEDSIRQRDIYTARINLPLA